MTVRDILNYRREFYLRYWTAYMWVNSACLLDVIVLRQVPTEAYLNAIGICRSSELSSPNLGHV